MKKFYQYVVITLILIIHLVFVGCKSKYELNLTQEEQKVIVEYAAGLLLKYDKNYREDLEEIEMPIEVEIQVIYN